MCSLSSASVDDDPFVGGGGSIRTPGEGEFIIDLGNARAGKAHPSEIYCSRSFRELADLIEHCWWGFPTTSSLFHDFQAGPCCLLRELNRALAY